MRNMSAMVMYPEQTSSASALYPRYPSLPVNGFGYNVPGVQHPHDYSQSQINDPGVQTWYNAMYGARGEDWTYAAPNTGAMINTPTVMGAYPYRTGPMELDYNQPQGAVVSAVSPGDRSSTSSSSASTSNKQLRPPYDWMKTAEYQTAPPSGKTRTKDKYRVVYTDHQRLELEKEFHYSRYITIRRKAELAQTLALSERQVKIWFQNRRAKERKQNKKRDENKIVQIASEHGDHTDETKHHMQQQINMQITPHGHPQVQVKSPSTESINVHYAYSYHHYQAQPNIIQTNSISPHNHLTSQFPSDQHNIPLSSEAMAHCNPCTDFPVTIKADLDTGDKASLT